MIKGDPLNHGIIQNLQMFPIPQTSNWSWTFFAVSYSKPALEFLYTYIVESFGHNNNVRRLFFSLTFDPSLFKKFIAVDREHDFLVQIGHLFSNF